MGDAHFSFALDALQVAVFVLCGGTLVTIMISLLSMLSLLRRSLKDITNVVGELEVRLAETNRSASI